MSDPRDEVTETELALPDDKSGEHARPLDRESRITARPVGRDRWNDEAERRAAAALEGRLEPPSSEEMLVTLLELNHTVSAQMRDSEIVEAYLTALGLLFPARRFAVRLIARGGGLGLVCATDTLDDDAIGGLKLTEAARVRHGVRSRRMHAAGVLSTLEYTPVFKEAGAGFDVPLMAGEQLAGLLAVEYAAGLEEASFDRNLVVPLAVQLAAVLRNAALLRESNTLRGNLERLLDHANAPIVVTDTDRVVRVVNRAFLAALGRSREELLGADFLDLLVESERGRILPVFVRALRGEPTMNFEARLPKASGGQSRLVINTSSILAADGSIEGVIAIGRDLTELRELEEQVIQAEKLATLGQLAAGVVHELNNPLTSISVYAEYLLRKGQRDEGEPADLEKLRRITESADRILKFTRDLVTYARPSSEEPAYVGIRSVVEQSLVFCEHVVSEVGASVQATYDDNEAVVYAVKGQLHQVFINLITNACHALPGEQGSIAIVTRTEDDQVVICVEDNGCGIPGAQRERIFEPFFSTKGEGKGTGLGLSIVRNIVQQHGGDIEVDSLPDAGTRFLIRLPGRIT